MCSVRRSPSLHGLGCPIRVPADQLARQLPAAFRRLATPFIGSHRLGIHRAPLLAWPVLGPAVHETHIEVSSQLSVISGQLVAVTRPLMQWSIAANELTADSCQLKAILPLRFRSLVVKVLRRFPGSPAWSPASTLREAPKSKAKQRRPARRPPKHHTRPAWSLSSVAPGSCYCSPDAGHCSGWWSRGDSNP
jgi:hypothetical protein